MIILIAITGAVVISFALFTFALYKLLKGLFKD